MNAITPISTTSQDELELTILMPCLNEAETIGICVTKARCFLVERRLGRGPDRRQRQHRRLAGNRHGAGARVVPVADKGYGAALRGGIAAARGRFIIMGDADDSYDFSALGRLRGKAAGQAPTW